MAIETRGTYSARPRDFSGPIQGPSKKVASSFVFGSSAGSGSSGRSSSNSWFRARGRHMRPFRSQLGRQQTGQFGAGGSFHVGHLVRTSPTPTQPFGHSSATGSSSGTHGSSAVKGGSQQSSGQRGCPMTRARLHVMTQQEGRTSPDVIIDIVEFHVLLGMDFLEAYRATVDCIRKEVVFRSPNGFEDAFQGERDVISSCFISAVATRKLLNKGCHAYLGHIVDTSVECWK
ncbi:hypothetical protein ACLB2K_004508 [Fragaria x ananassa]